MNIAEIESKLNDLSDRYVAEDFVFRFVAAMGAPAMTVRKLQTGTQNKAIEDGDLVWKGKLFFRPAPDGQIDDTLKAMRSDPIVQKQGVRLVLTTDGKDLACVDAKTGESLHIEYPRFHEKFDFFLPLAGIEKNEPIVEKMADVRATGKIAKFFDSLRESGTGWKSQNARHQMNVFISRVLFCLFAEDTGIFEKGLFTESLATYTAEDGEDVDAFLTHIFEAMSTKVDERKDLPSYADRFPYVNGGLFEEAAEIPVFSRKARRILVECGRTMNWAEINPDIFGSMIQAVIDPSMRGDLGMHYTSVTNIMKLLKPLFLDDLNEQLAKAGTDARKLGNLHTRLQNIRVFDPACGSGNFLIVAYKELRRIEMAAFRQAGGMAFTKVSLGQFYGIEYDDFAAQTAGLSLWIAEHQMNEEFRAAFPGSSVPALPLKDAGHIVCGNATRVNWLKHCPPKDGSETFIVGNPPYLGSSQQSAAQKSDVEYVFKGRTNSYKNLDYVTCWFAIASNYSNNLNASFAFVSTNSICQGEQVAMLWPLVIYDKLEIGFARQSFKWRNMASKNAGVTCVIVGIRRACNASKLLFQSDISKNVKHINGYLIESSDAPVCRTSRSISSFLNMEKGNMPTDGGHLILSTSEKDDLIMKHPEARRYIRKISGSREFIQGLDRWCIWIDDNSKEDALSIAPIRERVNLVEDFRQASKAGSTVAFVGNGHRFRQIQDCGKEGVLIPRVSSERRKYLPIGLFDKDVVITDSAFAIYNAPMHLFAILSSKHHRIWTEAVGGKLEDRLRYSNTLVYNTFPLPELSDRQKKTLEDHAWAIIAEREKNPGKTIADLYDPDTMPSALLQAHQELDATMDSIYGQKFRDDTHRLEHLFKLYARMTQKKASPASAKEKAVA